MAKRKASGKTASSKPAKRREKGTVVAMPQRTSAAAEAPSDEQQPAAADELATRGRKKRAKAATTPPHWNVGDTSELLAPSSPELVPHLAKCGQCAASARYTLTSSGHGLTVIERFGVEIDATFGIGGNGIPICPNGHGEMRLADEQLPAADAITQVAAKVNGAAATQRLPFPSPPFNHEGAMREVFAKRHNIAELEEIVKKRGDAFKDAKKELEDANLLLGKMIDEFERRAQDRADEIARQQAAAERDADVTLCGRITAIGFAFDVATVRALSAADRAALEAWLTEAEAHPDEVARLMTTLPGALEGPVGAAAPTGEAAAAQVEDAIDAVPDVTTAAAAAVDGDPVDPFDASDDLIDSGYDRSDESESEIDAPL